MRLLDKLVVAFLATVLLTFLAVAGWSLATGETMTVGFGFLEMHLKGRVAVLVAAVAMGLPTTALLWLVFYHRDFAYLALGSLLLILAGLAFISFRASLQNQNVPRGEAQWRDVTFVPLSALGIFSVLYGWRKARERIAANGMFLCRSRGDKPE